MHTLVTQESKELELPSNTLPLHLPPLDFQEARKQHTLDINLVLKTVITQQSKLDNSRQKGNNITMFLQIDPTVSCQGRNHPIPLGTVVNACKSGTQKERYRILV
jgi:hypothetical protein